MLRHLRSALFWLVLLTMAVNGAAVRALPSPAFPSHNTAVSSGGSASPEHMAMQAMPQFEGHPDCADSGNCVDRATGQCLASFTACTSPALAFAGSRTPVLPATMERPALPSFGPAGHFLTGAPDRPPRPLA